MLTQQSRQILCPGVHYLISGTLSFGRASFLGLCVVGQGEKAGKAQQVIIIGFDGQPEGKQAIKDGKIYADPIQFPDRMGVQIVEAIIRHSKGETLPPQMLIPTSLYRKADAQNDPALK